MSKVSDYKIEKFTSLKDTPSTYDAGKYVKVLDDGLDYDIVDTSTSGSSGGGLNYNYYFDTATDGNVASGTLQLNSSNYPGVSSIDISYYDKDGNDLSNWINSWDDSDKSVKGTLTLQSVSHANKYAMFKLTETLDTTFGSGKDGDVTISGAVNLNTTAVASGRTYADMIAYNVSSVGASSCQTTETPNGIEAGDAVLLINLQGAGNSQVDNVGNYEVFVVDSIVSTTITFKSNKTKLYGNNGGDSNLGTATDTHRVMLMRIPQYQNLTINSGAEITINSWDGLKYGVLAIMCSGVFTNQGTINLTENGYRRTQGYDYNGESYGSRGIKATGANLGGGGLGCGGGYATVGGGTYGGASYGVNTLSKLYLGSGGGGSHPYNDDCRGGAGGGIVLLQVKEFSLYGTISSNGALGIFAGNGSYSSYPGAGSGGSIMVKCNKLTMNSGSINAAGASPSNGGAGSVGRIAVYYNALMDSISNISPTPYTDSLTSGADKIDYNMDWLNNSGTFDDNEEVIVSYAYNY